MNVLIVEDERALADVLCALLKQHGYTADAVYSGPAGEDSAQSGIYDVIILDIMLPRANGLTVLRNLRQKGLSTPVLLLTAKAEISDKIAGLDSGADDYLTKPFATGELLARLRAMARRSPAVFTGDALQFGDLALHKNTHALFCAGEEVKLGGKEYNLLEMLLQNKGQILPKERLIEKVWGFESEAEYNAIEVYVSFLRKKLHAIGSAVQIKAVRGVGYTLEEGT